MLMVIFVLVTATALLWGHSAGEGGPVPDPDIHPERAYFPMQRSPRSILNGSGFLVHTALDDVVDVTRYQHLAFDTSFFFVGGSGEAASGSLQAGGAGRIGGNYAGLYFSGDFFYGRGNTADQDNPAYADAATQSYDELVVNDNLIVLFGNEFLGGLRFDLRFDAATFTSLVTKDGGADDTRPPLVTTLQWGRNFGNFSATVSLGALWGARSKRTSGERTAEERDYTRLGLKLEAAYGGFAVDYQLSAALDKKVMVSGDPLPANNGDTLTKQGGVDHLVHLSYTASLPLTETITLTARPQLHVDIYSCENSETSPAGTVNSGTLFYFGFAPMLEAALRYQLTPKIGVVTGVRFTLLRLESKTQGKGDSWTPDTGGSWSVAGAGAEGGSVAFELSPTEHFTVEAGIGMFDFNESEYQADITTLSGGFAFIFRL
jgi:hypothetical protein